MKIKFENTTDLSALWFVKLRWIAISAFLMFLLIAKVGFNMSVILIPNLIVLFILVFNNILTTVYLQKITTSTKTYFISQKRIINIQIISDLILLAIILHYSGSIENPFIAVYLLHIVLAAIILPIKEGFMITIIANLLLGSLVILEYREIIPHHQPIGFESYNLYQNIRFILLTGLVFTIMSFVILYFTSSITKQLRENQIKLNDLMNQFQEQSQDTNKYILNLLKKIGNRYNSVIAENNNLKSGNSVTIPVSYQKSYEFNLFLDKMKKLTELRLISPLKREKVNFRELIIETLNLLSSTDLKLPSSEKITDNFNTGNSRLNFVPFPILLSNQILPLCFLTTSFARLRPSPFPSSLKLSYALLLKKSSKTRLCSFLLIPFPVS